MCLRSTRACMQNLHRAVLSYKEWNIAYLILTEEVWEPLTWSGQMVSMLKYIQVYLKTLWTSVSFIWSPFIKLSILKGSAKFFVVVKSNVLSFPFLICLNFCHILGNKLMLKLSTMTLWHIPPSCPQIWTQHFPQAHVFFLQDMGSNADTSKMRGSERGSLMSFSLLPGGKEGFKCRQPHPLPYTLQIERSAHKLVNSMLRPLLVGHSIPPSPNKSWEL